MYEKLIKSLRTCSKIDTDCIGCLKEGEIIHKFCWLELMSEAATAIEKLQKPKWISVTERLPDANKNVLCCGSKGGQFIGWVSNHVANGKAIAFVHGGSGRLITHWQPLLEPPKEETDVLS